MRAAFLYRIAVVLALALGPSVAHAQKVGSTSMQFLKVMPSARAAAMGEAYSVMASGAEAIHWNPAGVADVRGHEFSATYIDWIFDSRQGSFAYATNVRRLGAIGLQVQYVDFGEFEETSNESPFINNPDNPGFTGRTFRPFSYLVGVTFSRALTDRFSLGLGAKYAYESLFDGSTVAATLRQGVTGEVNTWASGLLFDVGIRYATGFRTVEIGAAVQNFGPDVTYAVEAYPVPMTLRLGIAADLVGGDALLLAGQPDNRVRAAFDLFHPNDYAQQAHLGIEYQFSNLLSLRGGYKFLYDSDSFTFGGGLNFAMSGVGLQVDYSYGAMGLDLGNVQRVSLGVSIP
jgi:hypothetical protein